MRRFLASILFIFFVSLAAFAQTQPTATPTPRQTDDEDVVKISTTLIQLDVTVTDQGGKIVTDLKPEDFEVFENNKKQQITNFSFVANPRAGGAAAETRAPKNNAKDALPPPPPKTLRPEQVRRTIAIVVDDLTLSFESAYYVRRAVKKFVDEQMQDGDLVAIIRTGAGMGALQQFTSDRRQLYAAAEKIRWNPMGAGKVGAFAPIEASPLETARAAGGEVTEEQLKDERNSVRDFNEFQGSVFATGTLGALDYIVRGMGELPGRKSVILFSDGFKMFVKDRSGFTEQSRILDSLRRLTDRANRASVVIYTMDARGLQTVGLTAADSLRDVPMNQLEERLADRRLELMDTQDGLIFLAQQTGGFALINNNDLSGGVRKVLNDQNGYYLLGYVPDEETFDAKTRRFNKLSIKVKRPGLKVRYRSGFFGVSEEERSRREADTAAAPPGAGQTRSQQLAAALTSPFGAQGVDLRLNALFLNHTQHGALVRSLLHIDAADLKFTDEPEDTHKTTFEVLAVSFGDNGQVVDQIAKSYTLTVKGETYRQILSDGFVYNFVFPVKKPGAYQLRVALRDSATAKVGSANQFIEVPNLKKGVLTLSGIVVENISVKQYQESQQRATNPLASAPGGGTDDVGSTSQTDTSLRRFKRGTVLRYGFEVYNAKTSPATQKPQLTQQIRVFRDGKLEHEGKPVPITGAEQADPRKVAWVGALSLGSGMEPGDYVLQIIVTDNLAKEKRRHATQFIQFEVTE